ncbi:MAG: hypothetical protein ACTSX1_05140, partial [Candidatus Heimdallarchaeaceae archaeon]
TFADFAAGLLTNPIRLVFESTLDGKEGGIFDLLGGLFGGGKDKDEKSLIYENGMDFVSFEAEIGVFERKNGKNESNFVVLDKNEPEWQLAA